MDERELARVVAAGLGGEILAETERHLDDDFSMSDQTRGFGIVEAMAVGTFIATCARLALQVRQERLDRALLLQALLQRAPIHVRTEPDKRLGLIGRIVDTLIPERFGASPSLGALSARTKHEWMTDALGSDAREFSRTILMPFKDMDTYVVYRPIKWSPPANASSGLPAVTVREGFVTDLATVPSVFWWAIPPQGRYGHAAILHDWLYWEQITNRETADEIFEIAMQELEVALPLRKAMWAAVRVYGGSYWSDAAAERASGNGRILKRFPDGPVSWDAYRKDPTVFE